MVRLEEDLDVGGVGEGGAVRVAVPGPGLSQLTVLVVEPEIVPGTEVPGSGGGGQVDIRAGEDQLVAGCWLEVVGAGLAVWVTGGIAGRLEHSALPRVEDDRVEGLPGVCAGGGGEGLPAEHQPVPGRSEGAGRGGEVDGEAGGQSGEDQHRAD